MKILCIICSVFLFCSYIFAGFVHRDNIIAFVHDSIITENQVRAALQNIGFRDVPDAEVRESLLNQVIVDLVKQELLNIEAERMQIRIPPEFIDKTFNDELNNILQRAGGRFNLERQLSREGLTYDVFTMELRSNIESFLIKQQLFNQLVFSQIVLTNEDVLWRYNVSVMLLSDFSLAKRLFLKFRTSDVCFNEMVKKHSTGPRASEGGNLGYVKMGDLQSEIERELLNMFEGDVSSIITTRFGFALIKLHNKQAISEKEITSSNLEELKEHYFEAKAALLEKKLYKRLWNRYHIRIDYDKLLQIFS